MRNASVTKEAVIKEKLAGLLPSKGKDVALSAQRSPKASWIAWGPNPTHQHNSSPDEVTAGSRCPEGAVNERMDQKEERSLLPLIKTGTGRSAVIKPRNTRRYTARNISTCCAPALKPFQKQDHLKSPPLPPGEVTPWVKPSPSECSLTSLLCSVSPLMRCSERTVDQHQNLRDVSSIPTRENRISQTTLPVHHPPREKNSGPTKQRSTIGAAKRRSLNKLCSMKLPPVPAVTDLNFSRNFSFSFFEVPEHQSPQQWLQRQREIHITMRQLQW